MRLIALLSFVFMTGVGIGTDFQSNITLIPIITLCTLILYGGATADDTCSDRVKQ